MWLEFLIHSPKNTAYSRFFAVMPFWYIGCNLVTIGLSLYASPRIVVIFLFNLLTKSSIWRKMHTLQVACFGGVPERSKGSDCKSDGSAFAGSNPAPSRFAHAGVVQW
jgi:hypothetical protein